ncbi:MAG: IS66 family transposase [bacterium]|nr:IS66 family transposase [bacterium]
MAGLAEVLDENTALRQRLAEGETVIRQQAEQLRELGVQVSQATQAVNELAEKNSQLDRKLAAVMQVNDKLARALELIDKQRKLARAERFIADENQGQLFDRDGVQLPPRDPELQANGDDDNAPTDGRRKGRDKGGHPRKGRRKLADLDLPKKKVDVPVDEASCTTCGDSLTVTGTTTSHRVGWVPGHFEVLVVEREQCACPKHPEAGTYAASEPFLLPGSMCDDGLLARIIVDKHEDHLPLNRQSRRLARQGMPFGTNVLAGWVLRGFEWVRPVVDALSRQVVVDQLVLSDDTGHPVQDKGDGTLRKGRLWVFTDQRQAFYAFSSNKKGEHPLTILSDLGFEGGTLVADGGSEYNRAEAALALDRGGCWSHLRRYFTTAAILEPKAKLVLPTFRDLFLSERELAALDPEDRLESRLERSAPLVEGVYAFIEEIGLSLRPASLLAKACGYGLSQKSRMLRFLADGRVPLHNNLSELLLRQPVVTRSLYATSGNIDEQGLLGLVIHPTRAAA